MPSTQRFHRLAASAQNGCQNSLGELLEELRPYLLRVANELLESALRPKCGASDLVQETVIKAANGFVHFRGISDQELRRWLVVILKNQLHDLERAYVGSDKRRLSAERSLDVGEAQEPPALAASPEFSTEQEEEVQRILENIELLPDYCRQIVLWRHQDELSFAEIGHRLGCSHETARRKWYAAIQELARQVSPRLTRPI